MLEKKISKPSQNGDEKKDGEVVEMLETKNHDHSDQNIRPISNNTSEQRVTLRRVFKLIFEVQSRNLSTMNLSILQSPKSKIILFMKSFKFVNGKNPYQFYIEPDDFARSFDCFICFCF